LRRLHTRIGGLRTMTRLPDVLFVVDVQREDLAITEANKLSIPVVAMVDTNCDPDPITYPIPSNDDAIRAIKLMAGKMVDAVIEGLEMRTVDEADRAASAREAYEPDEEVPAAIGEYEESDEDEYLGPSTLAKLARGFTSADESNLDAADEGGDADEHEAEAEG